MVVAGGDGEREGGAESVAATHLKLALDMVDVSHVDGGQPPLLSGEERGDRRSYGASDDKSAEDSGEHAILMDVAESSAEKKNWVHVRNFISIWRLTAISVTLGLLVGSARAPFPNSPAPTSSHL